MHVLGLDVLGVLDILNLLSHNLLQLHLEISMPIDTVLLQCDVPVELLEADSNVAIVSVTPPAPGSTGVLATYR